MANNKYRGTNPESLFPNTDDARELAPSNLIAADGGINVDQSSQAIGLTQSPYLDQVRVEDHGLRQEYGEEILGDAAENTILALGEHSYVDDLGNTTTVVFRLFRRDVAGDDVAVIESWDDVGEAWVEEVVGDFEILDVIQDWVSFADCVFFADGDTVYKWDKGQLVDDEGDDFEAANLLTAVEESTAATIDPAAAIEDQYRIHFSTEFNGPAGTSDGYVEVAVLHLGVELGTIKIYAPADSDTARVFSVAETILTVTSAIVTVGDTFVLKIKDIVQSPVTRTNQSVIQGGNTSAEAARDPVTRDIADADIVFNFYTINNEGGGPVQIDFYVDQGSGFLLVDSAEYDIGFTSHAITLEEGFIAGITDFKIDIPSGGGRTFQEVTPGSPMNNVQWHEGFDVEVHGFNLATDVDPSEGVTYSALGALGNQLVKVYETTAQQNHIVGRYLGIVGERLVVLQADHDLEKVRWPVSGDMTDWLGVGSGESILLGRPAVDELKALKALPGNNYVLIRERSTMKIQLTGRTEPALAFFPWIPKKGTKSPFSVKEVMEGVMLLDDSETMQVLTEGGYSPVGQFVDGAFVVDDPEDIEAVYDVQNEEYIIAITGEI